jgi:hypothetical protein
MIVSVSRRCDVPRFRFDWFLECLRRGFADVANPFNAAQVRRVSLLPADLPPEPSAPGRDFPLAARADRVEAAAFWTRDPRPIVAALDELESRGLRFFVMVTLTGYPKALEPNVPPAGEICAAMGELSAKIGARRVIWRYDPVFLSSITSAEFHLENFKALARQLRGAVKRVIVSLYDEYQGAKRRIEALEKQGSLRTGPEFAAPELFAGLASEAAAVGMEMQSCAEPEELGLQPRAPLIKAGACIDGGLLRELWGIEAPGRDKNQRPHCRCVPSVDIGSYGNCPAACAYCYARR